ncbi:MAG: LuxR family transcriptional regulator [Proteobacteria bacterium]|nr:LuxR family transcriptional regulator [Pseudomonadota bacterium]NOG59841.1 LuxR family transcriptional regulator [Pseudomonadota bacterium]
MLDINEILFESRFRLFLLGAFVLVSLFAAIDIIADIREGTEWIHIVVEMLVFIIAITSAFTISFRLLKEAKNSRALVTKLKQDLQENTEQAIELRNKAQTLLEGLGKSINNQFERWNPTSSKKEIGLLLLKGLSHKEVAYIRNVSEATARQKARVVYKKAGLGGRHDLSAFFLEELALPSEQNKS